MHCLNTPDQKALAFQCFQPISASSLIRNGKTQKGRVLPALRTDI